MMDICYTMGFQQIATSLYHMGLDVEPASAELEFETEFVVVKYRWRDPGNQGAFDVSEVSTLDFVLVCLLIWGLA